MRIHESLQGWVLKNILYFTVNSVYLCIYLKFDEQMEIKALMPSHFIRQVMVDCGCMLTSMIGQQCPIP